MVSPEITYETGSVRFAYCWYEVPYAPKVLQLVFHVIYEGDRKHFPRNA